MSRHRNRCSETRNEESAAESSGTQGSDSEGACDEINLYIVINRTFCERPRSRSSKFEGHSPGTPTMFIKINGLEGGGGGGRGVS